jgi:Lrp/AsnC family transcriptional regulator, leucine-responsive regulatory protein
MKKVLENRGYDNLDITILEELQMNGRISVADLARKIHLSQPAVHHRIKRLEREGIIQRYVALLDREAIGYDLLCFVNLSLNPHSQEVTCAVEKMINAMPQVLECYNITGRSDMLLKIVVENHRELNAFIKKLETINGIDRIETSIVLNNVKTTTELALE